MQHTMLYRYGRELRKRSETVVCDAILPARAAALREASDGTDPAVYSITRAGGDMKAVLLAFGVLQFPATEAIVVANDAGVDIT